MPDPARRVNVTRAMITAVVATAAAAVACATNPATGQREISLMSEAQEIQLGQQSDAEVRRQMGEYEDPALQEYVRGIGLELARASERPNLPWHFSVVDAPAINAFALPGGYIYVTRGILPFLGDEAELAGVLGHEIGHVTARHSVQQYSQATSAGVGLALLSIFVPEAAPLQGVAETALGVLFLKYGRDDEREADRLGVRYTAATGWDPSGVAGMLRTLAQLDDAGGSRKGIPNWLSTHPAPAERVQEVQATIKQATAKLAAKPIVDRPEFLKHVDGVIFGDSPSEGIVRGNRFLHPVLRLSLTFPRGWAIQNTKTSVVSKAEESQHYLLLQNAPEAQGSLEQTARVSMERAGFRQIEGARASLNGLEAYVGTYQGTMEGLGNVGVLAAHVLHNRSVYLLAGIAPAGEFRSAQPVLTESIRSFRPLSESEAAQIKPSRIDLYTVRSGDTWASLAERSGGAVRPATLAIMNKHDPNQPPKAGDTIKIVVEG